MTDEYDRLIVIGKHLLEVAKKEHAFSKQRYAFAVESKKDSIIFKGLVNNLQKVIRQKLSEAKKEEKNAGKE